MENNKTKVLVMVPCQPEAMKTLLEKFGDSCEFCFVHDDKEAFEKELPLAEIIIGEPCEEELSRAKSLKWVQLTWAGMDKYTSMRHLPADLRITNASGAFGKIISEYVMGSIISVYRSFPKYWDNKKKRMWERIDSADTIYGKKVLILGAGDIGKNVAHRLKAFDAYVIGIKKTIPQEPILDFDEIYDTNALDNLLPQVDIVVGCMPSTPETKGLLGYERLRSMKKQAVLVNVGRGSLINTDDLVKVLQEGHLKGVCLDVYEVEPLPEDSPLWDMENVLMTPHISGPSFGGNLDVQNAIWGICIYNLDKYFKV